MARKKQEALTEVETQETTEQTTPTTIATVPGSTVVIPDNVEYIVIDKEEIPIIDGFAEVQLIQPGSVRSNEALADHVGKFMYTELDESKDELKVIPLGILRQGRQLFPPFDSGDNEVICRSYDGIEPARTIETPIAEHCGAVKYEKDFMAFRHTILDPECPKAKWEDGKAPDCSDFLRVAFFDLELKAPIAISFKGTGMSAWSAFKRAYARQEKIAKLKRQRMNQYLVVMGAKNKGTYFQMEFLFRESDSDEMNKLGPLALWYKENLVRRIVESTDTVEEAVDGATTAVDTSGDVDGAGKGVTTEDEGSDFSV